MYPRWIKTPAAKELIVYSAEEEAFEMAVDEDNQRIAPKPVEVGEKIPEPALEPSPEPQRASSEVMAPAKRPPGRPPGSKNRK